MTPNQSQVTRGLDRVHLGLPLIATQALWFFLPAALFGLGTWLFVLYAGYRVNSLRLKIWGFLYLVLAVLIATAGWVGYPAVAGLSFLTVLFVGGLHSANCGRRVWYEVRGGMPRRGYPAPMPAFGQPPAVAPGAAPPPLDPAIVRAQHLLQRRQEARRILEQQPALAQELRIGRPDQPRGFDDGGLVDVNHVPAGVLAATLELPGAVAERIVAERQLRGGLSGPDELVVYCGLTPDRVALIRDRLLFQPW